MALTLIASLLAFGIAHAVADLVRLRDWRWFGRYVLALLPSLRREGLGAALGLVALLAPPVLLLGVLWWWIAGALFGLLSLIVGVGVLFMTLGPRDLNLDLRDWLRATDNAERDAAAQALNAPAGTRAIGLIEPVFGEALKRWFGPLFWFIAFGPAGALLYRLTALLAEDERLGERLSPDQRESAGIFLLALGWLPAHLMSLALALASDFDAVSRAWREHHQRHGQGLFHLDLDFLAATARACIDADDIEEGIDSDLETAPQDEPLKQAHGLIQRVLVVWFVAMAVLVLAGAG